MSKRKERAIHLIAYWTPRVENMRDAIAHPEERAGGPECVPQWQENLACYEQHLSAAKDQLSRCMRYEASLEWQKRYTENCLANAP